MSTRIHRFIPRDVHYVPEGNAMAAALTWLRKAVDARIIDACIPRHILFFDCGEDLELVGCPHCGKDVGSLWQEWMDESFEIETGFVLTERTLQCCGRHARLDQLVFDANCAFGSFAIEITDTKASLSDDSFAAIQSELEARLGCALHQVHAHY